MFDALPQIALLGAAPPMNLGFKRQSDRHVVYAGLVLVTGTPPYSVRTA